MRPTVVLTRPRADSERLAGLLTEAGFPVLTQPLLATEPLPPDALPQLPVMGPDTRVVFISANAVRHSLPLLAEHLHGAHLLAVGERTAAALSDAGFAVQTPALPTSEGLLALPALTEVDGASVVIVKGEGGRQHLTEVLRSRGADVEEFACYRRVPEPVDAAAFAAAACEALPLLFVATSGETLDRLSHLLEEGGQPTLKTQPLLVPSARVAGCAVSLGWADVHTADDAADATLLRWLESRYASLGDQEAHMTEQPGTDTEEATPVPVESAAGDDVGDEVEARPTAPAAAATAQTAKRRDGFARLLAGLTLALVLALAGLGVWAGKPWLDRLNAQLDARDTQVQELQAARDSLARQREFVEVEIEQLGRGLRTELSEGISAAAAAQRDAATAAASEQRTALDAAIKDQRQALDTARSQLTGLADEQRDTLRRFDDRLAALEAQLARLTATDRRAWLVQEAAFLTRLASQRLLVARDVDAAVALLTNADDLLVQTKDPAVDAARRALASDRAALRALPDVDIVGLHARLAALIEQAATLNVREVDQASGSVAPFAGGRTWVERAEAGWEAAWDKLSSYIVVRRRDEEMAQLLTPEWESLARQNLRMLLEQAQIALLSGNQELFDTAVARSIGFAEQFRGADPGRTAALIGELEALRGADVAPVLPDLMASRRAFDVLTRSSTAGGDG